MLRRPLMMSSYPFFYSKRSAYNDASGPVSFTHPHPLLAEDSGNMPGYSLIGGFVTVGMCL